MWTIRKEAGLEQRVFPSSREGSGSFTTAGHLAVTLLNKGHLYRSRSICKSGGELIWNPIARMIQVRELISRSRLLYINNYEKVNKWSKYSNEWLELLKAKRKYRNLWNCFGQKSTKSDGKSQRISKLFFVPSLCMLLFERSFETKNTVLASFRNVSKQIIRQS